MTPIYLYINDLSIREDVQSFKPAPQILTASNVGLFLDTSSTLKILILLHWTLIRNFSIFIV